MLWQSTRPSLQQSRLSCWATQGELWAPVTATGQTLCGMASAWSPELYLQTEQTHSRVLLPTTKPCISHYHIRSNLSWCMNILNTVQHNESPASYHGQLRSIPGQFILNFWQKEVALGQVLLWIFHFYPVHIIPSWLHTKSLIKHLQ
jgi:hypothetical protein